MKWYLLTSVAAAGVALAASLGFSSAEAQEYPNQPIRVIVPFGAGGGTDIATRMWAELVGEKLGQRVLVENMGGAAGTIGTKAGIAAEPDGYTLFAGVASTMSINPYAMAEADYDPLTDVQPVTLMTYSPWNPDLDDASAAREHGRCARLRRGEPRRPDLRRLDRHR